MTARTAKAPIETKVVAGGAGTVVGVALGKFVLWLLGILIWHAPNTADHAASAAAAVPDPVSALVLAVIAVAGSVVGGYIAPHTPRPHTPITHRQGLPVADVEPSAR